MLCINLKPYGVRVILKAGLKIGKYCASLAGSGGISARIRFLDSKLTLGPSVLDIDSHFIVLAEMYSLC